MKLLGHDGTSITVEIDGVMHQLNTLLRYYYKPRGPLLRTEVQHWRLDDLNGVRLERTTLPHMFTLLSAWRIVEKQ
ncbi:hypothetical protein D3875_21845 [Deinococcus cavernae]|uniref:Uncharacterized protein n=1 Tax=Deinococcus cavernae TaxID=2320857 RepID=A0A418UZS7_9DEIO|nr:hypothetical protein [Deinococcus cavernae]RJF68975.1 hypothetical protein D3875_21845 [Deinococcus cavernae]